MKEDILQWYNREMPLTGRNSMGCLESWYNEHWAISQTFTEQEVKAMSDREIELLERLGNSMSEAFY